MPDPVVITVAVAGSAEAATADFVCDGVDDEIEINAAIAAAVGAGGGVVRLAAGDYTTTRPIVVLGDGVALEGDSAGGTVIRAGADWASIVGPEGAGLTAIVNFVGVDNFAARHLIVEATALPGSVPDSPLRSFNGIQAIPTGVDGAGEVCTNGVFEDNTVRMAQGHTYSLWSLRSEGMQIIDNLIDGRSTADSAHPSQEGIEIFGGRDVLVSGNTIIGIGNAAINVGGISEVTPDSSVEGIVIVDNHISFSRVGVFIGTTWSTQNGPQNARDIQVEDNVFDAMFETGFLIRNWTGSTGSPPEMSDITFRNNQVNMLYSQAAGFSPAALWFFDATAPGETIRHDIVVEGNSFTASAAAAIPPPAWLALEHAPFVAFDYFSGVDFRDNALDLTAASHTSRGITAIGSEDLFVTGNDIRGAGTYAVEFYQTSDFAIGGNVIADWGRGVQYSGILVGAASGDYSVAGNELHDSLAFAAAHLLNIYDSDPYSNVADNLRVSDQDATLAGSLIEDLTLAGVAVLGIGNAFANVIKGNALANVLKGGGGTDMLIGLGGNDTYFTDVAATQVIEAVGGGNDMLFTSVSYVLAAGAEVELLSADDIAAVVALNLTGNGFDQVLIGNAGANVLKGGGGTDVLTGLGGDDTYYTDVAATQVVETVGGGSDTLFTSVSYVLGAGSEVERLSADDIAATVALDLTGNGFDQVLTGNAGANVLKSGGGTDTLIGLGGDDIYFADAAATQVVEAVGGGSDTLFTSVSYVLAAGSEVEQLSVDDVAATVALDLTGNGFDQILTGNAGANVLKGGGGTDTLVGLGGDDTYYANVAATQVVEAVGGGNDTLFTSVSYVLGADVEVERLAADNATLTIALHLTGNGFDQILTGNAGANVLKGGGGTDVLTGLGGDDTYFTDLAATQVVEAVGGGSDTLFTSVSYVLGAGAEVERLSADDIAATVALDLTGNGFDQILTGNAGANVLKSGGGTDTLIGLGGDDIYFADAAATQVVEAVGGGSDTLYTSVSYVLSAGVEVERLAAADIAATVALDLTGNGFGQILTGNAGANVLKGGGGADTLIGLGGDDTYFTEGAATQVVEAVGGGNDQLFTSDSYVLGATLEVERLAADNAAATVALDLTGNGFDQILTGNAGANVLKGGGGTDTLIGLGGSDTYFIDVAATQVVEAAGGGSDTLFTSVSYVLSVGSEVERLSVDDVAATVALDLTGNAFDQILTGNAGANVLKSGGGADTLIGLGGDDIYFADAAATQVVEAVGGGSDTLYTSVSYVLSAGVEVERLAADNAAATFAINLTGNAFGQTLTGNAGANILHGGGGTDTLIGYGGNDIYFTDVATTQVVEATGGGSDQLYTSVSYALGSAEVELLSTNSTAATTAINLTGNSFNQTLVGNNGNNVLHGGGGTDVLIGYGGNDVYFTDVAATQVNEAVGGGSDQIYTSVSYVLNGAEIELLSTNSTAGAAAINLTGNGFNQTLLGNAGANMLHGGGGTDTLVGYGGNDIYFTDVAATQVVEAIGGGSDQLYTSVSYVLTAGSEIELLSTNSTAGTAAINLTGNAFSQTLLGNNGANILHGGGGVDTLIGYAGNDIYFTDVAATQVVEAVGGGNDQLYTSASYTLAGGSEIELLSSSDTAGTAAIDLIGNGLANAIYGNAGTNTLDGKSGADTLFGYGGADRFAFTTALGSGNVDSIGDFAHGIDKISLDHTIFTGLALGALASTAFVTGAAAADVDDRIIYNSATGALLFDADGNGAGAAILFATLQTGLNLTASDFILG